MGSFTTQLNTHLSQLSQNWGSDVLIITGISLITWIAWRIICGRLAAITEKTQLRWDDIIISSLKTPISTLIWCWPATMSVDLIIRNYVDHSLDWFPTLRVLFVILIFIWVILRLINNIEELILSQKKER